MNIRTSYFVQLNNNTYNALSLKNRSIIKEIEYLGHKIGLHFTPTSTNHKTIEKEFFELKLILEKYISKEIDRFSFHRPNLNRALLKNNTEIEGMINVYNKLYFEYFEQEVPVKPKVKYISDSNHKWRYGHPLDLLNNDFKKVHILFHPFSWSMRGGNNLENFLSLVEEKNNTMLDSINSEISNFPIDEIKRNGSFRK